MSAPVLPEPIGVVGAGTMGAGIAQLAAVAGLRTLVYDAVPGAAQAGCARIVEALQRAVTRERLTAVAADAAAARVTPVAEPADLTPCRLVVEAAPEQLELKLALFAELSRHVSAECVLATNTSSLSVTEIAAAATAPERVVGLHFFNPPTAMALVEVVAGAQSSEQALATARAVATAMGRHPIDARDIAGFLVNRCNRPYQLEPLRLLAERIAPIEQIDRIMRLGAGFRMGPFELMDLIGLDTNFAVAREMHRQTFGEPRYQPSPLQARMVAAGRLGRKSAHGWYAYPPGNRRHRLDDPEPPAAGGGAGRPVAITGDLPLARELRASAAAAGWAVTGDAHPWLIVRCDGAAGGPDVGPRALLLASGSLHSLDPAAIGFHALAPFAGSRLVELTRTALSDPLAAERTEEFFASLGRLVEWVGDAPGLVTGRVVCQLINEAAFLIGEGNATAADVDAGMTLGVNHPRGPVEWSRVLGLGHVVGVLEALQRELGEPRYRVAPLLARQLATGADLDAKPDRPRSG